MIYRKKRKISIIRRILVPLAWLCGALILIALLGSSSFLKKYTDSAIPFIEREFSSHGLLYPTISFKNAQISSYNSITWFNIESSFILKQEYYNDFGRISSSVENFSITVEDINITKLELELRNFEIFGTVFTAYRKQGIKAKSAEAPLQITLKGDHFRIPVYFDTRDPRSTLGKLITDLLALIRGVRIETPFSFEGVIDFVKGNKRHSFGISSEQSNDGNGITAKLNDIKLIAKSFSDKFTDPELKLISKHPLRVIRLMQIKNKAESISREAYEQNSEVPEDAYRHIIWSYLLTKEYLISFAEEVTDAHEAGLQNSPELDKEMDYHNNRIGRLYARKGIPEEKLLARIMADHIVIQSTQ